MNQTISVLVVDDEPMLAEIVSDYLEAFGFTVELASSADEAFERVRSSPPDILLLDIMIPGLDGRELCRRIKADPALAHILIVLTSALREEEVEWQSSGADGFHEKHHNLRALPGLLRSLRKESGGPAH